MLAIKTKWKKNNLTAHINTYTLRFQSKKIRTEKIILKKNYKPKMRIKNISKPRKRKKRQ